VSKQALTERVLAMTPEELAVERERDCGSLNLIEFKERAAAWRAVFDRDHDQKKAEHEERAHRLANATGCPKNKPVIPWLIRKGLLMKTPSGDLHFTPAACIGGGGKPEKLVLKHEYEI
jgi:hypothetical protein